MQKIFLLVMVAGIVIYLYNPDSEQTSFREDKVYPTWKGAIWLDVSGSRTQSCVPFKDVEKRISEVVELVYQEIFNGRAVVLEFGLLDAHSDDSPPVRLELPSVKRPEPLIVKGTTVKRAKQRRGYEKAMDAYRQDSLERIKTIDEFNENLKMAIAPYKTKSSYRTDVWGALHVSENFFQEELTADFNKTTENYLFLISDAQHNQSKTSYSPLLSKPSIYLINCADNASDNQENGLDEQEISYGSVSSLINAIKLSLEKNRSYE